MLGVGCLVFGDVVHSVIRVNLLICDLKLDVWCWVLGDVVHRLIRVNLLICGGLVICCMLYVVCMRDVVHRSIRVNPLICGDWFKVKG